VFKEQDTDTTNIPKAKTKAILSLTPSAVQRVIELVSDYNNTHDDTDEIHAGIRIALKKGGCAGMEYAMDIVQTPQPSDEIVHQNGVWVYIAASAIMCILGTEIDYTKSLLRAGFVFNNPNVIDSCGCGISFTFSDQSTSTTPSPDDVTRTDSLQGQ
jgi:iron-sulfur cluster assembly protein